MAGEQTDKRELLKQLSIDRDAPPAGARRPWWLFVAVAVFGGLGLAAWWPGGGEPPAVAPTAAAQEAAPAQPARSDPATASPVGKPLRLASNAPATAPGDSVLDATGYVVARRQATVSSKQTGKVVEVLVEEGMAVEQGQLLATLDDSIQRAQLDLAEARLAAARSGLRELDVARRQAQLDLDRTRGLAERNLASTADLDSAALAVEALEARIARAGEDVRVAERGAAVQRQVVDDMRIRAPFSGIVVAKAAQPGEMISPVSAGGGFTRTGICSIVDMDSLEVEVDVNEAYINRIRAGQPARIALNAYPGDHFPAEVIAIIPTADRSKATVRVRVGFLDRDSRVLPDMGVQVAFLAGDTGVSRRG